MRRIFTLMLLFVATWASAQTTVYYEDMGTPGGTTPVNSYAGWSNIAPVTYSSNTVPAQSDVRTTLPSSGYASASAGGNVFLGTASGNSRDFVISGINTTGYSGLELSMGMLRTSVNDLVVDYSTDGVTWINMPYTPPGAVSTWTFVNFSSTVLPAVANLRLRFTKTSSTQYRLDDIYIVGTSLSATNFYSKAAGNLDVLGTWGSNTDGSGASPANFTAASQLFNLRNRATATIGAPWTVSGAGSKLIVGDGFSATEFVIPAGANTYTGSVEVANAGLLTINNTTLPTFSTIQVGSAIDFAQAATVVVPVLNYYDLKLTNGTKTFSAGTTNIRGDLTVNGVTNLNGAATPFSTLSLIGNLTLSGGSTFEPNPSGDGNRLTLNMEGSGTQTINGGGATIRVFRLGRVTTTTSDSIILGPVTDIVVGNNSGGGLQLNQGAATTTTLVANNSNNISFIEASICTSTSLGTINSTNANLTMNKTVQSAVANRLRFGPACTFNNFIVNMGAIANDSFFVANNFSVSGTLTLTNGKVIGDYGVTISFPNSGTISGGGANAYLSTIISKTGNTGTFFSFPFGQQGKYAPIDINNWAAANTYTAQYFWTPYPNMTVDPVTQAAFTPQPYIISHVEYWQIDQSGAGSAELTLYWNGTNSNVAQSGSNLANTRMAHFDGTNWDDLGALDDYNGDMNAGYIAVWSTFTQSGPYTFAELIAGLLPIKLQSFTGKGINNAAQLNWIASCSELGSYFTLERSNDAQNFTAVADISTNGVCTNAPFTYTDNNARQGKNYYRLKLVNHSGAVEYSNTVLVNLGSRGQITLMQNPVKDVLTVNVSAINNNGTMRVIDMNGKIVATQSFSSGDYNVNINTSSLLSGNYILQVVAGDEVITQKFVKF